MVHEYFRVDRAVIEDIVDRELVALREAIRTRMLEENLAPGTPGGVANRWPTQNP